METDQAKQPDALLNQSLKVLNINCDTVERDASTTLNRTIGLLYTLIVRKLKQK